MRRTEKYALLSLLLLFSYVLNSCSGVQQGLPHFKQGVYGQVLWIQGNWQPSTNTVRPPAKESNGIQRQLYIYEITQFNAARGEAPLFSEVRSHLIAKVKTNKAGYFHCRLKPGQYSIFTREPDGWYFANVFDGQGHIAPFEVKAGELTRYQVNINYKAAY